MKARATFYVTVLLLALGALLLAWLRHLHTGISFVPGQERTVWLVEARIDYLATGSAVTASLSLPEHSPGFELYQERAASPGYGFAIMKSATGRRAEWTRRQAEGGQSLYYTAEFVETDKPGANESPPEGGVQAEHWDEAQELAARQVIRRARETSSSVSSFTRELIKLINSPAEQQNMRLLLDSQPAKDQLLLQFLALSKVPARSVLGLSLRDARRRQQLTPMVEVYTGEYWSLFDPLTGATGVPENFLLWQRGGVSLLDVTGGVNSRVSFSIIRQTVPARQLAMVRQTDSLFALLGVHRLPIEEQSMFKLLLLLPLGAAVVVFMRVIIGLKTAGTFMPILIALAFLQTTLVPGLISFIAVLAIGLALRSYLSRLNLLLVARIATLIVLVVFVISMLSIVGYEMGYSTGMTITFFPMIIIAWTIERMSILWEEEGPHEVLLQGGGSLLVAVVAYFFMQLPILNHLTFNFPELNLVLLAGVLAMGQYTGYKLTEVYRFRAMDNL